MIGTAVQRAFLSAWLPQALRSMSKETILGVLEVICSLIPGWRENVAPATELIQKEHPFCCSVTHFYTLFILHLWNRREARRII